MDKAIEKYQKYIDFWVKVKPSVSDKILFCIYIGQDSPHAIRQRLQIAKGNLANYCKRLVADKMIVQHTQGRVVRYDLVEAGQAQVKKFLEAADASL